MKDGKNMRILISSLMVAGAYALIFYEGLLIATIAQVVWMIFQINLSDTGMANLKVIGLQLFILFIIVSSLREQGKHHDFNDGTTTINSATSISVAEERSEVSPNKGKKKKK